MQVLLKEDKEKALQPESTDQRACFSQIYVDMRIMASLAFWRSFLGHPTSAKTSELLVTPVNVWVMPFSPVCWYVCTLNW